MNRLIFLTLPLHLFLLFSFVSVINYSGAESNVEDNAEDEEEHPEGRAAIDIFDHDKNISFDVIIKKDNFSIISTNDKEAYCLDITDMSQIPKEAHGSLTYGEECDPSPNAAIKCKRVVTALKKETGEEKCLKATHLMCDPTTRRCICSRDNMIIPQIRFQFGNEKGKTLKDGRCFIRPTFDTIDGIECSPGTKASSIVFDDEIEQMSFCGCVNEDVTEKFNSTDPAWWVCGRGSLLQMDMAIIFTNMVILVVGNNVWGRY